ncbi:hypothetical protein I5677_08830 [Mobilitalea sibirica]|uniref:Uncharacterized protein n=2 Tax=Mobilitalea sibirica TaxID=1462919 RepID=A0A8J7H2I4_9FIRM|nr:hypothetical protein [Mobilitalea sibirica]
MPWCPKCKMEYREGIDLCSDCKVELVDQLQEEDDFLPFFQAELKSVADKLKDYFEYSKLNSKVQYDEENEVYILSVPADQVKQAKKLYQAFYFVERERQEKEALEKQLQGSDLEASDVDHDTLEDASLADNHEDSMNDETQGNTISEDPSDDQEDVDADAEQLTDYEEDNNESDLYTDEEETSAPYIMKADQYKDYNATVWIFSLFGIGGIIVVILNIVGILSFFNGLFPNLIMSGLFLFFLYIGLSTSKKAKLIQADIDAENKLTEKINLWLEENITESFLASIHDESISEELNYLKKVNKIKLMLNDEFGKQNSSYLDRLIEEYYSNTFEK